jgi:pyrophosphatase PpaX
MPSYQTILFDLDGTLIDSVDLIVDSYQHTYRAHGLPVSSRDAILAGMGVPLRTVFGELTSDPAEIDRWIGTYREYNLAHHDQQVQAYPGVVEMVRAVRQAGFRTGLVTSKNNSGARRGLALIGLEGVLEVIIGSDNVSRPKPDPEPVLAALAELQMPTTGCLFVGDSHHDMHSGRAAGVQTVGVTWGPFNRAHLEAATPDFFCEVPEALLQLLDI